MIRGPSNKFKYNTTQMCSSASGFSVMITGYLMSSLDKTHTVEYLSSNPKSSISIKNSTAY